MPGYNGPVIDTQMNTSSKILLLLGFHQDLALGNDRGNVSVPPIFAGRDERIADDKRRAALAVPLMRVVRLMPKRKLKRSTRRSRRYSNKTHQA
jgi:hypothetical protein